MNSCRKSRVALGWILIAPALAACAPAVPLAPAPAPTSTVTTLVHGRPGLVGMRDDLNATLDSIMAVALNEGVAPGAS
ncbi:MAG: hypothetical protein ABIR58_09950, partial [Gemmatimonadaceae bacterium]